MTVCEACRLLCDGLGPYCFDCREEIEVIIDEEQERLEKYDNDEP
jgi:hypothetical protein